MLYLITFSYQMQTFMADNKQSEIIQLLYKYIYKKHLKFLKLKLARKMCLKAVQWYNPIFMEAGLSLFESWWYNKFLLL